MGLLEILWDDTVAGPQPDSGLGRLRKFSTFNPRSPSKETEGGNSAIGRSYGGDEVSGAENEDEVRVSRKIMIVKPPGYNHGAGSAPASPAGSTPPQSPFSGNTRSYRCREADQEHSGFEGDQHQMRMRRHRTNKTDPEALFLLKMVDI